MSTDATEFQSWLDLVGACAEARNWAGSRSAEEAWTQCKRADWLMWWAARRNVKRKILVRLACRFAREVLELPSGK